MLLILENAIAIYNMVKSMKKGFVPHNDIGMQGHYNVYRPSMEDVDAALTKYSTIVKHPKVFTEFNIVPIEK